MPEWMRCGALLLLVAQLVACGGDPSSPLTDGALTAPSGTSGPGVASSTSNDATGEAPACNEPSPTITPQEPSSTCVPDVPCVSDANCPEGHACNTALAPPGCALLYCGGVGTPCHDDTVCAVGSSCHDGLCNPCTFCGDLCEVDFAADPAHCGCCDNPVPEGGVCNLGVSGCPPDLERCGDACVDLAKDPLHCGGCDTPVGPGADCINGALGCAFPLLLCDGTCIDPTSDADNCGECGATCPYGACIGDKLCALEVDDPAVLPLSCAKICEAAGMACFHELSTVGEAVYRGWCDATTTPLQSCKTIPSATAPHGCGSCTCAITEQRCHCHPKAP